MGLKTNGDRCDRNDTGFIHLDAPHLHFCQTHWDVYNRRLAIRRQLTVVVAEQHHRRGTCHKWVAQERWCGHICPEGSLLCLTHAENDRQRRQQQQARQEARRVENDLIENTIVMFEDQNMNWRQAIDTMTAGNNLTRQVMYRVSRRMFLHPVVLDPGMNHEWQFNVYWQWAIGGRIGPAPDLNQRPAQFVLQPRVNTGGLAAIARDSQNVHTTAVSQQTNAGLDKLLAAARDDRSMRSPEWLAAKWLVRSYGNWNAVSRIVNDMQHWYNMSYCKAPNDYLYRRTLDGLYLTIQQIKDMEIRTELYRRSFEECYESVGQCCEGPISRLCNVLVGFDDAFAPPVPFGEILQNKMAAIAALEVDTQEKLRQATEFFNEFAVPETERSAWLEAF